MALETETRTMQAIVQSAYGDPQDVLTWRTAPRPVPRAGEVLVRVRASSLNFADVAVTTGRPTLIRMITGLLRPRQAVPGKDMAGTVEAVGADVTDLEVGDEVYAEAVAGAWAQYVAIDASVVARKPRNVDFAQAACLPLAGGTALDAVAGVLPGQRVLVNGASGGVGTFAVQLAKARGAEVTGVCSGRNVELVTNLGADHVIDYDRVIDLVGNRTLTACRRSLTPTGTLVLSFGNGGRVIGPMGRIVQAVVVNPFVGQRLHALAARRDRAKLDRLRDLVEAGHVTPAVERTYPLSDAPDALRRLQAEHARGKTVLTVA